MRSPRFLLAIAAVAALLAAGAAQAQQRFYDPPGRVARISDMRGYISYSPAGDGEWYDAHRNRPLVRGDALWSDRGARAELQAGSTWIRIDQETSLEFLQLDDRMVQVQVAEGTVNVRVRRLYPGQRIEIDTPNVAFVIDRPGNFRLDVDRDADNTTIEARQGGGRVYGVGGRFDVRNGDVVVFYGEDVRDYELYGFPGMDAFDRYARMRDQRIDRSQSLRYLGDDLVGYSDLDDYGRWSRYPNYGNVWFPSNTYAGWAPYQDGQWIWQDPWGWTWVDEQPWGFAPSHYGRWAWIDGRWGWVPGPRSYRPVYAPALVAFMQLAGNAIGWFPLGPSDVYYPTYNVSQNYFRAVNIANTSVPVATVNSGYNSYGRANVVPVAQGGYRNRSVPTAVTAVPQDVFVNARPVRQARRDVRELAAATQPGARAPELRRTLAVRPERASMRGAAVQARVRPPREVQEEQVIVHNAPPPAAPTPAATATPAPTTPVRERRRVRQVTEQQAATDARARGPRHEGESAAAATPPAEPVAATPATATAPGGGRLRALDREALARDRAERRAQRAQRADAATPATPATPATRATPAVPATPATPATPAVPASNTDADAQKAADEARAAQRKAREEQRQASEAQRKAQQEQRDSERALREAQQQREQADQAQRDAQQQREAADAEAKAVQERQQARAAQQQAREEQRQAQQAQREAAQQQAEASQQKAKAEAAAPTADAAPARPGARRDCVPQERIDAMRKRGVDEARIAELKVCAAEPQQQ
jgi:hypothetical protein